jgi:TonB family protein
MGDQDADLEALFKAYDNYDRLHQSGQVEESLPEARTAFELGRKLFGMQSEDTANLAFNYAFNLSEVGDYDTGQVVWLETLDSFERVYGDNSVELVPVLMSLGNAAANMGEYRSMLKNYERALRLSAAGFGADSANHGWNASRAGADMWKLARESQAQKHLRTGHEVLLTTLGPAHEKTAFAAFELGLFELDSGNTEAAHVLFQEAAKSFKDPDRPLPVFEQTVHAALVQVNEIQGNRDAATPHLDALGRVTVFRSAEVYRPIYVAPTEYPRMAKQRRLEGYAIVEFRVDEQGYVRDATLFETGGDSEFGEAALAAAGSLRFIPRFDDGEPVAVEGVRYRFDFNMHVDRCGWEGPEHCSLCNQMPEA